VNLWTIGCADARLTAQARSPMDKPGKTPCVSPTLPTGRRLPTSFTAPPQHQGLNLIPGKVKPFSRRRALAYSSRNLSKQPGPPHFTPREFVVTVLKAEFRMNEDQAMRVMMTAHRRGACVVAVYTKDVAEAKATNATDAGRSKGYPLLFTTEPEE
jgi:ATP-dependent Clp protease adaptor protein ClpS